VHEWLTLARRSEVKSLVFEGLSLKQFFKEITDNAFLFLTQKKLHELKGIAFLTTSTVISPEPLTLGSTIVWI
jgi:hypothetical protein